MADQAMQHAWVERVLGVSLGNAATSQSTARAQEAQASNRRGTAYPKLLLRWRQAQSQVVASMEQFARDYVALPNVQADPRIDQVRQAVTTLPSLIPAFGEELADLLDQGINAGTDTAIANDALAVITRYRNTLGAAATLGAFEQFSRKYVGDLGVARTLDGALAEIATGLQAGT